MGYLRDKLVEILVDAIDKKVDGKELTKEIDKQLDKKLNVKTSEKIQRGPLSNLLLEMLEGLWEEDLSELKKYLRLRYSL